MPGDTTEQLLKVSRNNEVNGVRNSWSRYSHKNGISSGFFLSFCQAAPYGFSVCILLRNQKKRTYKTNKK